MPKNNSIKKVLVIGSGPIVIGQAAEFDYAACPMTIGPEPITSTFLMSVLLGILTHLAFLLRSCSDTCRIGVCLHVRFQDGSKLLEEVAAVLRTRRALRVILYGEDLVLHALDSLDRIIEKIDMGCCKLRVLQAFQIDRITVVLGSNLDFSRLQVLDRVVTAAVAELELVGLRTVSQGDHLVTEADTEDRKLTGKCFYR